ncbi:MAG: T9SS type A sorting domain-containing protein [Candidatus Cloacimonadota bacterium]|nr:T9SS type A sorting domain-containing protein [Candidatus Cloacimonadota bacterium]
MKKIILLIFIIFTCSLFARYKDVPVTRDLDPNAEYDTYQDWLSNHPQQLTQFSEVSRVSSNQREEGFLIVINNNLYGDIEQSIQIYQEDLTNDNFDSFVLEYNGTSHEDLREQIINYAQTENVTNVVLIGNLPVAWFELFEDWNNNGIQDENEAWVEFPCDLYFADIDGTWEDTDANDIYDYHEGDKHPEIGIGRIVADNMNMLPDSEAELINDYFQKNHLFRSGIVTSYETSLAYIDDDWSYWGPEYQQAMQLAYPSVVLVNNIEATNAGDYRDNRLIADYEFIQVHVHSGPNAHYFYYNNGNSYALVNNYEIPGVNPTAHFYNLFACSNSRFTTANNMGAMYIYGSDHGLVTLGSTKTGSMLWFEDFYEPFGVGTTIGEALRLWWEVSVDVGNDWRWQRSWFYGMIIQGDPSLLCQYEQGDVIYIPQDFPTIQAGIDAASDGFTIFVDDGTYQENLIFDDKDIILQSIDGAESCIIDGSSDDSVITIQNSDNAVISGFTIQNGLAASFGGGIDITGSPTIDNCVIQNNYATHGGGIHITGSPIIMNNIIQNNSVTIAGGGIRSGSGEMVVQNNMIIQNNSEVYGGGIHVATSNIVEISSNVIKENTAQRGAAICFHNENAGGIILNNLVIDNVAEYFHTDFGYLTGNHVLINNTFANNVVDSLGIGFGQQSDAVLINNILWENADEEIKVYPETNLDVRFCNVQGGWEGEGNIDVLPRFVGQSYGNYNITGFSHCVGAGIEEIEINGTWYYAPELDIEGTIRPAPVGSNPDIGAYENLNGEPYVSAENNQLLKLDYSLQNYPNPFNPSTTISFETTNLHENTRIEIYNLKGQKIKTFNVTLSPESSLGKGSVTWNGTDSNNKPVSSGIYFYKLIVDKKVVANKKMLLIK